MKKALVLGGGAVFGSAWESGVLVGLAEAGVDVRTADSIIGTSAGSQVGAVVASGLSWDELWARQVDPVYQANNLVPRVDMADLFRRLARIQNQARNPREWIENWGALALEPVGFSEAERLKDIDGRIQLRDWPERLGVVAVDAKSGERVVWTRNSGVDFVHAISSSCALPGVWPCITIAGRHYCDGGVYSMENADLTTGFERVLILSPDLPIPTPYTLDQHVEALRRSGSMVEIVRPDEGVLSVLRKAGGNPLDPQIRTPVVNAAKIQGRKLAHEISSFWNSAVPGNG